VQLGCLIVLVKGVVLAPESWNEPGGKSWELEQRLGFPRRIRQRRIETQFLEAFSDEAPFSDEAFLDQACPPPVFFNPAFWTPQAACGSRALD
jgi:hypothetical protein